MRTQFGALAFAMAARAPMDTPLDPPSNYKSSIPEGDDTRVGGTPLGEKFHLECCGA
jgi:hypothetical protein